jgi:hypothetical protein
MSAVLAPISFTDVLADAVHAYVAAKRAEEAATAERVAAEQRILALHPAKEEGAETFEAGGYKVTLTGKLSYTCDDLAALVEACAAAGVPPNLVPTKTVLQLDATGAKWLRAKEPDLWARVVAPHVTIKPAKTAVKVTV